MTCTMRSSWFMVEDPGNMGLPPSSSPRMQPAPPLATHSSCSCSCSSECLLAHASTNLCCCDQELSITIPLSTTLLCCRRCPAGTPDPTSDPPVPCTCDAPRAG